MMNIKSIELISDLASRTEKIIEKVELLKSETSTELNWKFDADSWSILECIEHLNLYGDFYLPEIESRIQSSKYKPDLYFKSGLLGNYFATSMLPKEKLNKMKTFKDKNPNGSKLERNVIDKFLKQQQKTLELLDFAKNVSLSKTKTAISISKLIKLRLGDTFRVVIYHNQRHLVQIDNCIKNYNSAQK